MSDKPILLFVDDEERIVRLLKIMFRAEYDVHTALSAREALAIMETVPVDVIASDQRMPVTTGIQLLGQVRERWPMTVRLLLTGYADLVAIVGAINEGEVFRFLKKPWNQTELREVIAEAVQTARSSKDADCTTEALLQDDSDGNQFAFTSQVLAIEGCEPDRQEVVEMFTLDYRVHSASNLKQAVEILAEQQIGVIVTGAEVDGVDVTDLLAEVARIDPTITVVVMTASPHSDTLVKLINRGRIYRFAIKPLSPNLLRLAVNAAIREHHRRLADPRITRRRKNREVGSADDEIYDAFVKSLGRFTQVH